VSLHIYDKETLTFNPQSFVRTSWLPISTSRNTKWFFFNLQEAISGGFRDLSCKRLQGIKIEIEVPRRDDPRQIVLLCTKVKDLVELISKIEELPDIDIIPRETYGSWSINGTPHKSITTDLYGPDEDSYDPDFEAILMLFYHISQCSKGTHSCSRGFCRREFDFGQHRTANGTEITTWKHPRW
jgi:hypothetical protein